MSIVTKTKFNPLSGSFDLISDPSETLGAITGEPMGFQNNAASDWSVTYDPTTRTVTATPNGTQSVFVKGKRFDFSAPVSLAHANATAEYFFFFDDTGTIQVNSTPFDYENTAHVAYVDHDTAQTPKGYGLAENHGVTMDWATHNRIHQNPGTIRLSGGALTNGTYVIRAPTDAYNAANSALADIQPGVDSAVILDEDKQHTLAALVEATGYTTFRKDWTNSRWIWSTAQTAPYYQSGNVPQYNPSSGGAALASLTATAYFCTYLVGLPVTDDASSQAFRFVWIPGQQQYVPTDASPASRTLARNNALAEDQNVALDLTGIPATEFVLLGKLVLVYDTGNTGNDYRLRIGGYQQLTGSRTATGLIGGSSPAIHNNLANRDAADAHPASAITNTPAGTIAATTVQAAINELDGDVGTVSGALSAHIASGTAHNASAIVGFDEAAQDAAAAMATSTPDILQTYTDATPALTASWRGRGKNFVTNPDAAVATTGLSATAGTPTIIRNTTNPLCGSADFGIQNAAGAWEVTWTVNALNLALHNRLGELGLVLKGAAIAGGYLRVFSGATKVFEQLASSNLILDENNPKKFGGTFPVGALPATITITLGGSGAITGNSIGGTPTLQAGFAYLGEPVSASQGGIFEAPKALTPSTTQGLGTLAANFLEYERSGVDLIARGRMTLGTVDGNEIRLGLPSGLTVASTPATVVNFVIGKWWKDNASASTRKSGAIIAIAGNSFVRFSSDDYTAAASPISASNGSTLFSNGDIVSVAFTVPISGWQATDIVTPEASLVEYASTNGTWDANDTTVYRGADGSVMGGALTASRAKTVTWQKAATATDSISIEFSTDRVTWFDAAQSAPYTLSSSGTDNTSAGVYHNGTSVVFARYRNIANDDSPVTDWPNNLYWRVKKIPAGPGQQSFYVQGPVKAAESGLAIGAGYAGYKLDMVARDVSAVTTGASANASPLITLTPGNWMVYPFMASGFASGLVRCEAFLSSDSNNASTNIVGGSTYPKVDTTVSTGVPMHPTYVSVPAGSTLPLYGKARSVGANTTVNISGYAVLLN